MAYIIGTDEAGYGPNLGPLVISATLWEVPDGVKPDHLFDRLSGVIASAGAKAGKSGLARKSKTAPASETSANGSKKATAKRKAVADKGLADDSFVAPIVMADSKAIYSPGKGLRGLERGLWAALAQVGHRPRTWRNLWESLAPGSPNAMRDVPWYQGYDAEAPTALNSAELDPAAQRLRDGLASAGVRLVDVRSRAIFAHEFNSLLDRHLLKSTLLSHETLALAASLADPLEAGPIFVVCDKHGGRNRYAPLLSDHFPDHLVEIYGESLEQSVYRFGPSERRFEVCFRAKAESCLPAALASMASKYLRESAMQAFNQFWANRVPGLMPTAGYPQDAKRFRADVAESLEELQIGPRMFWREV